MLDMNHEKNFDNNITLNNLSTKLENIINSTNNTDEKQIENETNLNNLLSAMENKNFKPIGSTGKTPMRPLLNSNNSYQDKSYNHDYSILQEKIGRMNNNRPNHDSEVSPLGNISNSSSTSINL
ncbi:hypothetical protein HANVADRAFT_8307 [Hanseniaspora valbyensis NRRL Y-1626]|uniref:Uncharacterized protein n=1 Tax=Hanseniaspora valbyensis NRRL Y-1626 TaxID=766949 RepID=A0A1B7T8H7_9ASCO|nr:hypothetical protein HANVADRAFT_8307 [Hanseniaspora valbyensis NRRL Y-1626]